MRPLSLPIKIFIGECGLGVFAGSISGLDIAMPTSLSMDGAHLLAILALEHCTSLPSNSKVNKCHNSLGLLVLLTNLTLFIHFHHPDLSSHLPQQLLHLFIPALVLFYTSPFQRFLDLRLSRLPHCSLPSNSTTLTPCLITGPRLCLATSRSTRAVRYFQRQVKEKMPGASAPLVTI